jgi:hypothetical protein
MISSVRNAMVFTLLAGAMAAGTVLAPTPSAAQSVSESAKSAAGNVSKWTLKQWNHAKVAWAKEKAKWAECNKNATAQKLSGHKSWSFLYDCMTTEQKGAASPSTPGEGRGNDPGG